MQDNACCAFLPRFHRIVMAYCKALSHIMCGAVRIYRSVCVEVLAAQTPDHPKHRRKNNAADPLCC